MPSVPRQTGTVSSDCALMDLRLFRAAQAGDELAFETLFRRYHARVYRQAWSLLGDKADAEDITQEVFLTLYHKASTFRGTSSFSTWLYRITANAAFSRLRDRRRQALTREQVCLAYSTHRAQAPNVEHHAIRAQGEAHLHRALEALQSLDQVVVMLCDLEGLANRETGNVLGLSLAAVKARRYRAHQALKGHLSKLFDPT